MRELAQVSRAPASYFACAKSGKLTGTMQVANNSQLIPGAKVKVTQQITNGGTPWTTQIKGSVVSFGQRETGSWFAHSKDDHLWLDRLTLKKEDGEIITLNLDDYSHVEVEA